MSKRGKINILDCTLRDGGYINEFDFGRHKIRKIINGLSESGIDIVECGFLESGANNPDKSLFSNVQDIGEYIQNRNKDIMYVAMIAYGDISIDEICEYNGESIEGIRLTFHEEEIDEALIFAEKLMAKGYKVFIQPVGTVTYTDQALLNLISRINLMNPFAFYLVDTLGNLSKKDLIRMLYLIDSNLEKTIKVGFHSHNNLQLSFSNAQELIDLSLGRDVIIDSSVFGMGRGAGNLCTELLVRYINENIEEKYDIIPILEIMDEHIMPIYQEFKWGYSAPYCLAAMNGCHPNYASYLIDRQTLCIRDINKIIKSIDLKKRHLFDKTYIKQLYIDFQSHHVEDEDEILNISKLCEGREVFVIAPGKSVVTYMQEIQKLINNSNPVIFSVNFMPNDIEVDRIFVGNSKKFESFINCNEQIANKIISTSNVVTNINGRQINYARYMKGMSALLDNSGILLLDILKESGVKKVNLAGFDGYDGKLEDYCEDNEKERIVYEEKNKAIIEYLSKYSEDVDIVFITPSLYEKRINNE